MMGERENFGSQTQYGSLFMRAYDIDGNKIDAFYDSADNLVKQQFKSVDKDENISIKVLISLYILYTNML